MDTVYIMAGDTDNSAERREVQPTRVTREWISYPEAEKYCGLSHTTLWRYVSSGELKAARVGRSVRIHLPSLEGFMEGRVTEKGYAASETR